MGKSVLGDFKLNYEDIKKRQKRTVKKNGGPHVGVRFCDKCTRAYRLATAWLVGVYRYSAGVIVRATTPSKRQKKRTKLQIAEARAQRNRGIIGIGQLFVVVSITYSTAVILMGVDSVESKVALLPQASFALAILFKAFFKLYK